MILRSKSLMPWLPWLLLGSLIFFIFFIFSQSSSSPPFRKKELKQRFTGGWTPWCDLSNGSWVRDIGSSHGYTNQTCKSLPESKNCGKYGKKGDYERWRWKPKGCELPRFNAAEFLEISKGKRLAFIGDSVARNQADSLVCFLSEVRLAISNPIGENSGDDNLQSIAGDRKLQMPQKPRMSPVIVHRFHLLRSQYPKELKWSGNNRSIATVSVRYRRIASKDSPR